MAEVKLSDFSMQLQASEAELQKYSSQPTGLIDLPCRTERHLVLSFGQYAGIGVVYDFSARAKQK